MSQMSQVSQQSQESHATEKSNNNAAQNISRKSFHGKLLVDKKWENDKLYASWFIGNELHEKTDAFCVDVDDDI
jgi:hypothetical protein